MNPCRRLIILALSITFLLTACNRDKVEEEKDSSRIFKGLYSFGPEIKSFTDCEEGRSYWVADSAKTLELAYSNLNFAKPYEPVYIEVVCHMIKSDSLMVSAEFDSTMVVTRVLKIAKEIPDGPCN